MPPKSAEAELRQRVDAFVEDLSELIRQSALEAVQDALGAQAAAPARRGPGRKKAGKKARAAARGGKRVRRSAEDLDRIASRIVTHVSKNPGLNSESLGKALGLTTKDLRRPMQMLIADGKIKTKGQRRGMTYFAGRSGTTSRKAKKK